ncbi:MULTISPECIES: papain fold toxin domain-containing protein [Planktothrix]|uniref:papain fold toxin domain-containing protein n=1 Tax=Planktothrix TaxID=54304 RepID=UPI0009DC0748
MIIKRSHPKLSSTKAIAPQPPIPKKRSHYHFLYDDSIGGDAISETGYHEGVIIIIDGVEIVFDNHHPQGLSKGEWLANFQFFGKIHLGQELIITEEDF